MESAMRKPTQFEWIAQAEARRFEEFASNQHATSESHAVVVELKPKTWWTKRFHKNVSPLSLTVRRERPSPSRSSFVNGRTRCV